MFCSAAAACICVQAATADDEQKVENRSMIYRYGTEECSVVTSEANGCMK